MLHYVLISRHVGDSATTPAQIDPSSTTQYAAGRPLVLNRFNALSFMAF